ncbi:uncharacterized protein LOC130698697 [Daphnia carinata]|uniref:uncharacterized protein LOC130698697 n=1 Tax=Daphnia carinata TaxID=120202 RepID=UPI002868F558|nr:uncharacterized protein LOC130698697 [Daphnia carinata]
MAARYGVDGEATIDVGDQEEAARAASPNRSCTSNSTGRLDPTALVNKRSHHRRNFTQNLNLVRKVIGETGASSYTADLIKKADTHYEQSMYYHHRYCAKLGINDDTWLENLRRDFQAVHEEFEALRHVEQPDVPSSPAAKTRTRVHVAVIWLIRNVYLNLLRWTSPLVPCRAAELELKLIRKRREEEKDEDLRLSELARKRQEEKEHVTARRQERKIKEEIGRLRMSEELSKKPIRSSSPISLNSLSESDEEFFPSPSSKPKTHRNFLESRSAILRVDGWIDNLEHKPSAVPVNPPVPWMSGGSAPFACKTPFDGDPRDWLLFASRFQAFVHDVIPNDAQRLAILTELVGPAPHLPAAEGAPRSPAAIRDLLNLPFVKPGDLPALELFSDPLHGAVVVLEQGGLEHDLKSAANLHQAVQKLPPLFRHRWAPYVRKRIPRILDLSDLDRFLEEIVEEEKIASASVELTPRIELRGKRVTFDNPNLTRHPSFKPSVAKSPPVRPPPTVLSTQAMREADIECPSCGEVHRLSSCAEFRRKSPNDRALVVKEKGFCFNCLAGKHRSADCRSKPACESSGCRARHHSLLHSAERVFPEKIGHRRFPPPNEDSSYVPGPQTFAIAPRSASNVLLAVVQVRLRAGDRTLDVFALLDIGSQATLLREDAAEALGLTGRPRKIRFGTFHGKDPLADTRFVDFTVSSLDGEESCPVSDAFVVPNLNVGHRRMKNSSAAFEYLLGLDFPARDATEVKILIGMDVQDAHLNLEVRRPPAGVRGPNAVRTPFGWCIVGKTFSAPAVEAAHVNFVKLDSIELLEESVERRTAVEQRSTQSSFRTNARSPSQRPRYKNYFDRSWFENLVPPVSPGSAPSKPNKVRLVYDAAARFKGIAINDILLKGLDLTTQLLAVLLRFRERRIAVTADIARMFYQVLVRESDRPIFRFLWREPGTENPIQEYQMTVHIFGAVSSPTTCSFALQRLEKDAPVHLQEVASRIHSDFYVDNLLSSFDEVKDGTSTCQKLVELLSLGGFNLVQFLSSSRLLLDCLPSASRLTPDLDFDFDDLPTERTLGYLWSSERDEFLFFFKPSNEAQSKRSILAAFASIYDPLGLLAPVVLVAKIILQDIWRLKSGRNEVLPADILNRWGRFMEHLPTLESLNFPRSIITCPQSAYLSFQLHAFSDASKDGFGVVVYFRSELPDKIEVSFTMAKVRVAPILQISIPKMELQGALLAVRLVNYLLEEMTLPISSVFFWVDAMTVLRWIHANHHRYNVFVANRISEILDSTTPQQWRHVPGILSPADECSHGLCPSELDPNHRWYRGPEFLILPPEHWPAQMPDSALCDDDEESIACLAVIVSSGPLDHFAARIDNPHRLVRIVAWIKRFTTNMRILNLQR